MFGFYYFFFFNDTATTEIYTLSLHDALPISLRQARRPESGEDAGPHEQHRRRRQEAVGDLAPARLAPKMGTELRVRRLQRFRALRCEELSSCADRNRLERLG